MTTDYKQPNDVTKRVRFYDGQFLQDQDFIDEQKYHLDREARLGRSLQVAGIVEGLEVTTADQPFFVHISPGTAVDQQGRTIVLAQNRTELDQDGLPILTAVETPVSLPAEAAGGERLLYIVYYQMPVDMQQSQQGLQSETRWQEAPYIFTAAQPVGVDDEYGGPPWDSYLATRPTPVLLARLQVDSNGLITVISPRTYSGLRLPGPDDGASWVMDEDGSIKLRYGQEDPTNTLLTIGGQNRNGMVNVPGILSVNGMIGVGTTTPEAALHLSDDNYTYYGSNSSGAYLQVGGNGRVASHASVAATNGNLHIDARDGNYATYINYYSKNNTYLNVQGGNVGIGTDNPSSKLEIVGGGGTNVDLVVNGRIRSNNNDGGLWIGSDRLFGGFENKAGIWNGNDWRLVVTNNGNVGIGTSAPEAALHLSGDNYTYYGPNSGWGAYLQIGGNGRVTTHASVAATNGNLHIDARDGNYATYINYYSKNNTYLNVQGGNVGIGTAAPSQRLDVAGNVKIGGSIYIDGQIYQIISGSYNKLVRGSNIAGSWYYAIWESDIRLKEKIQPLNNATTVIKNLRGVTFRWNEEALKHNSTWIDETISPGPGQTEEETERLRQAEREKIYKNMSGVYPGLIAQEVEEVLPDLVSTDESGYKGIRYELLPVILIEAFKELDATVQDLTMRLNNLRQSELKL